MTPPDQKSGSKARAGSRVSAGLVALGSATVVAIYSAGFYKTKAAADRFAGPPMPGNPRGPIGIPGGPGGPGRGTADGAGDESVAPGPGRGDAPAALAADAAPRRDEAASVTFAIPTVPRPAGAATAAPTPGSAVTSAAAATPAAVESPAVVASSPAAPPPSSPETPAAQPSAASAPAAAVAPPAPAAAAATSTPAPTASLAPAPKFKDGTYTGWGTCRHGDIQARIEISGGRIVTSEIAQCLTRYSCSWISPLPPQVITRQSENVDYVSGATDSAIAFYWAVFDALSKAK